MTPAELQRVIDMLNLFVHFTPDGYKDVEANHADPVATLALAMIREVEDLADPLPQPPPPIDAADVSRITEQGEP